MADQVLRVPATEPVPVAAPHRASAAAARVPHRCPSWPRRRQTAQPGQERDRRMTAPTETLRPRNGVTLPAAPRRALRPGEDRRRARLAGAVAPGARARGAHRHQERVDRRRRPRLRRAAAGARPSSRPAISPPASTSTATAIDNLRAGRSHVTDVSTSRSRPRSRTAASCRPPTGPRSREMDVVDRSASRRRCARPRTPTSPTSSRPPSRWRGSSAPGSSWSSSRRPIRARPRRSCCRASRRPASTSDATSSWPSRRSASIPATRASRPANIPKVVGGITAALQPARRRSSTPLRGRSGAGVLDPRRRDGEAAREHLPQRQHRAGQRDGDDVRRTWASTCGR